MKIYSPTITGSAANTNVITVSQTGSLTALSASFAATSSFANNFTVGGTLTAQTINVQIITSSIEFNTGSTRNGALSTNTHQFTGSVNITGGLVDINKDGQSLRIFPQTSSGSARIQIQNSGSAGLTGANAIVAVEDSTGGSQFTGTSPFSLAIGTATQKAFHLGANSAVVMTLTGSNVGIGTSTPGHKLDIANAGVTSLRLNNTANSSDSFIQYDNTSTSFSVGAGANGWFHYTSQTKRYDWWIANVIQMQLGSNGNLLIGTTTDNGYKLRVEGNIYASSNIYTNSSMYAVGGIGSQAGIVIDYGYAYGINSNNQVAANAWYMQVSTSWSNGFRFFYGGVGVGTGVAKAQIDTSGNYSALSDINKKKDIALSTLGLNEVLQLKPSTFKFKDDENDEEQLGFIAQEVKDIIPHAYYEDAEGDNKFIGLKYNAMMPVLVKAIQELKSENDTLKEILQRNNIQ